MAVLLSLWIVGTVTALLALGLGFLNGFFQRLVWEVAWCKSWESGGGKAEGGGGEDCGWALRNFRVGWQGVLEKWKVNVDIDKQRNEAWSVWVGQCEGGCGMLLCVVGRGVVGASGGCWALPF